jgi:lysozyme
MKRRWSLLWAARFVSVWEGFSPVAYLDIIAVPAIYTLGYGHTGNVHAGERVTKAQALRLLSSDLRVAARAVKQGIHVKLSVRQRMALIDLAFNCGGGAVIGSTLAAKLNAKDYRGAADCFLEWDHAGGVVVQGLKNRREAERAMFLSKPKKRRKK